MTYTFYAHKNGMLYLRLRNNNKKAELSLKVAATKEDLILMKPNSVVGRFVKNYSRILDALKFKLNSEGRRNEDVVKIREEFEVIIGFRDPVDPTNFIDWYMRCANSKKAASTRKLYLDTIARMEAFDSNIRNRSFSDITHKWLIEFEEFMALTASKNARNIHLRNIRAAFNYSIDHEATTLYPFRRFKIRNEETRKRSLSAEALRVIFNYPVEPHAVIYRDMFSLMFMLIGINTIDLYNLEEITDGRIIYKRAKTGKMYSIKIEPEMMKIINKYRGRIKLLSLADRWKVHKSFMRQCNDALKTIGGVKRSGLGGKKTYERLFPELSTYYARHSWATIARKLGISKDDIALALGHSDDSHKTTNIYIDEDLSAVDRANRRVLDYVLYGKE